MYVCMYVYVDKKQAVWGLTTGKSPVSKWMVLLDVEEKNCPKSRHHQLIIFSFLKKMSQSTCCCMSSGSSATKSSYPNCFSLRESFREDLNSYVLKSLQLQESTVNILSPKLAAKN